MDEKNDDHAEPVSCEELIEQLRLEVTSTMSTYQDKLNEFEMRLSDLERKKKLKPERVVRGILSVLFAMVTVLAIAILVYFLLVRQ